MSRKRYYLEYPNGGHRYIDREQRDSLLVSNEAKQIGPTQYLFTGTIQKFHDFADLHKIYREQPSYNSGPNYLPGQFIVEFGDKRRTERLETPKGMALRMAKG